MIKSKSFEVQPGDTIKAQVYAKYSGTTGGTSNLSGFASALLTAFGLPAPGVGESGTPSAGLSAYGSLVANGTAHDIDGASPKGYLNIIHFDKDFNFVDMAYLQLDEDYVQTGVTKMPHHQMSRSLTITKAGYVYVFLSNEGAVEQNIYFDDATYTHIKSPVVQSEDYYAFGMAIADRSYQKSGSMNNPYQYNGKEKQDELDLGWLDYGARMYDAAVGRWHVIDPLMEVSRRWSPYVYCYNNPIIFVDPDGRLGTVYGQEANHATGSVDIFDFSGGLQGQSPQTKKDKVHVQILSPTTEKERQIYNDAKDRLNKMLEDLEINLTVEISYGDKIISKADFYKENTPNSSYILAGTPEELSAAVDKAVEGGWGRVYGLKGTGFKNLQGDTANEDFFSVVNLEAVHSHDATPRTPFGSFKPSDEYEKSAKGIAERFGDIIRHEHLHQFYKKFGHVWNTILQPGPVYQGAEYNEDMLLRLREVFKSK